MSDIIISRQKKLMSRDIVGDIKKKTVIIIGELIIRSYIASKVIGKKFIAGAHVLRLKSAKAIRYVAEVLYECFDMAVGCVKDGNFAAVLSVVGHDARELLYELGAMFVDNKRKIARAVFAVAFSIMIGTTSILGIVFGLGLFGRYSFSQANWDKYSSDRDDMIDSLEEQYNIVGMSNSDIEGLLGTPELTTTKAECQYKELNDCDFDDVVEYTLNGNSKSIFDVVEKHYAVAYKDGKAVWSEVVMADIICDSEKNDIDSEDIQTARVK